MTYPLGTVLKGQRRRELRDRIAFDRAYFELEYEGRSVEPLDAAYVSREVHRKTDGGRFCVSASFVKDVQARVKSAKRDLLEFDGENVRKRQARVARALGDDWERHQDDISDCPPDA